MSETLQWCVLAFGAVALGGSVRWKWFFRQFVLHGGHGVEVQIAQTLRAFLRANLVVCGATGFFAVNSVTASVLGLHPDIWNTLDPSIAQLLRLAIFGSVIAANLSMSRTVQRLQMEIR